jgi:tetratricopeptide (TPR) repeat protein
VKKLLLVLLFIPLVCFAQTNEAVELLESGIQKVFDDKFDEALIDFNQALEKDQKGSIKHKIYFERAQLKRRHLNDFNGALKDYNSSIKFNPNYVRAYVFRGLIYERNFRDIKSAEKDYRKSIAIDPNCGACLIQLGFLSSRIEPDEMIIHLEKALEVGVDLDWDRKLDPNYYIYGQLASIKEVQEDYLGAIESYERLIDNYQELDTDGDGEIDDLDYLDDAHASISEVYFENLNEIDLALDFINKAIEINPDNKDYYTQRAKIKYAKNEIEGALEDYSTAKKTITKTYYKDEYIVSNFYPYQELDRNLDSIKLPITVNTRIEVSDILGLDTTNDQFFMAVNYNVYSKLEPKFINYKKDTLTLFDLEKRISPSYVSSDRLYEQDLKYQGYDDINITDEVIYSGFIETDFFHNWNLKEYPFDTQKLEFQIGANIDTSILRLNQSRFFKSTFNNVKGLKEGYQIDAIEFEEKFNEQTNEETFFPGVIRKAVYPVANYSIVISRSGGWLFVKLFLGSFLAFIISWIVFLIPNKEFDSRISLTVGGIFGAIGNRYFVDSTIPAVQVLTKADMINNMILALLILNVLIVIVQKNSKINFGLLEQNKFAMIFTGLAFVVLNTLIVLW